MTAPSFNAFALISDSLIGKDETGIFRLAMEKDIIFQFLIGKDETQCDASPSYSVKQISIPHR